MGLTTAHRALADTVATKGNMKWIEVLPGNPMPGMPKFKIRLWGVRIFKWCVGVNSDYKGVNFVGVWRWESNPNEYGNGLS